jgi:apolipoprotein N-acyltransferase
LKSTINTVIRKSLGHYYLITAILVFLSFPSYDAIPFYGFSLFAWFALVPLLIYVKKGTFKKVYITSFLTFLIGCFFSFGWFRSFGKNTTGGQEIIILFLIPCLSLIWSARILIAEFLSRRHENLRMILYPSVWIAGDVIQSLGFLAFPWNYWGYSQYPVLPLIQIASFTGVHGVTFLVIMGNVIAADGFIRLKKISVWRSLSVLRVMFTQIIFVCLIGLILVWGWIRIATGMPDEGRKLRVAMIQTYISPWEDWFMNRMAYLSDLLKKSREALERKPDLIIWSESASLEPITYDFMNGNLNEFEMGMLSFARNNRVPMLTGEIGVKEDLIRKVALQQNSAVLINEMGIPVQHYAKIHLAPFGEWFPYEKIIPLIQDILYDMGSSSFVPGDVPNVFSHDGYSFGVLICYEGMFYRLNRFYAANGVNFLVNITNDGWSDAYSGHMQHYAAAKFRAVENGIYFIRAGNTGFTTVIDPLGRNIGSIPILTKGYLVTDINIDEKISTMYTRFGDIFTWCILILMVMLVSIFELASLIRRRGTNI